MGIDYKRLPSTKAYGRRSTQKDNTLDYDKTLVLLLERVDSKKKKKAVKIRIAVRTTLQLFKYQRVITYCRSFYGGSIS